MTEIIDMKGLSFGVVCDLCMVAQFNSPTEIIVGNILDPYQTEFFAVNVPEQAALRMQEIVTNYNQRKAQVEE